VSWWRGCWGLRGVGGGGSLLSLGRALVVGDAFLAAQIRGSPGDASCRFALFLSAPVLADLAQALHRLPRGRAGAAGAGSPRAGCRCPLRRAGLWFLQQLEGGETRVYTLAVGGVGLRGALDGEALEGALRDLIARHESLRTLLVEQEGEAQQRIVAAAGGALHAAAGVVSSAARRAGGFGGGGWRAGRFLI